MNKAELKNLEIFYAIADYFNAHNIMTDTDFNDICDSMDNKSYNLDSEDPTGERQENFCN